MTQLLDAGGPDQTPNGSASDDKQSGRGTRSEDGSTHLEAGTEAIGRRAPRAARRRLNSTLLNPQDGPPVLRGGVERGWGVGGGRVV